MMRKNMKRKTIAMILCFAMVFTTTASVQMAGTVDASGITKTSYSKMTKGVWIAFCDFKSLGLYNKSKSTYTKNVNSILKKSKADGCNTVYFHVRAFDDAAWSSSTFRASEYLMSGAHGYKNAKAAYSALGYDPFGVFVSRAAAYGMKVEAYMNPYRVTYSKFLDPSSTYSRQRIYKAVREIKEYNISGIHFDDYFYHSSSGKYIYTTSASKYSKNPSGKLKYRKGLTAAKKRSYCNTMVRGVYNTTHYGTSSSVKARTRTKSNSIKFGISPAGNYSNCMAAGADVKSWLSKSGYIDYCAPQIYWTNKYKVNGKYQSMYSNRLSQFTKLNKIGIPMYIGLALYRTGTKDANDKGWSISTSNIKSQVVTLRSKGSEGYILFSGANIKSTKSATQKEIKNLKSIGGI